MEIKGALAHLAIWTLVLTLCDSAVAQEVVSSGTGFLVGDRLVATNFHVIDHRGDYYFVLGSEESRVYELEVVRSDKTNDLSVLRINDPDFSSPGGLVISSRTHDLASEVFTIGYPLVNVLGYKSPSVTEGIISSTTGIDDDPTMYQITVPVQPGNSGGPLFNSSGDVVGVVASKLSDSFVMKSTGSVPQNVNFAIKAAYLNLLVADLVAESPESTVEMRLSDSVPKLRRHVGIVVTMSDRALPAERTSSTTWMSPQTPGVRYKVTKDSTSIIVEAVYSAPYPEGTAWVEEYRPSGAGTWVGKATGVVQTNYGNWCTVKKDAVITAVSETRMEGFVYRCPAGKYDYRSCRCTSDIVLRDEFSYVLTQ